MTTPAEAAVRASECTVCPGFLAQCAHLDGQAVGLVDESKARESGLLRGHHRFRSGFTVVGPAEMGMCICGGHATLLTHATLRTDSLAAARAEFALRERKLLGREEA